MKKTTNYLKKKLNKMTAFLTELLVILIQRKDVLIILILIPTFVQCEIKSPWGNLSITYFNLIYKKMERPLGIYECACI